MDGWEWEDGVGRMAWADGDLEDGVGGCDWEDGNWEDRDWADGDWADGDWEDADWEDTDWENGVGGWGGRMAMGRWGWENEDLVDGMGG